ncbi:MAG: hypothetical protein LBK08_05160 [Treponema sp.]|nr:hypothetical protein [Treponema sp.]
MSKKPSPTKSPLNESGVEDYALKLLEDRGWRPLYGPSVSPGGENPLRRSFEEVFLADTLARAAARINPGIPPELRVRKRPDIILQGSPALPFYL